MTKPTGHVLGFLLAVFATGYLLSSLLRGVTAALAPYFTQEFAVTPAELGLLAGSYFASFALMQLPMGMLLDRYGVRLVLVWSLTIAAISCVFFAIATSFQGLFWARLLSGVGVSACLIAPLTAARLWTAAALQQRVNSWMLMSGALGLLLGTLPSESVADVFGWRALFVAVSVFFAIVAGLIAVFAPKDHQVPPMKGGVFAGYAPIIASPFTWKIGALGLLNYAILVAVQTLWIGPWLTEVSGETTRGASIGLLYVNTLMLVIFLVMGYLSPKIIKSADDAELLLRRLAPASIAALIWIALLGADAQWYHFAIYCAAAWPLSVTHPLVGQRFSPEQAGRAIAFFNLLLFVGVFAWQWSFGIIVTSFTPSMGLEGAYQLSIAILAGLSILGYLFFTLYRRAPALDLPVQMEK